MQSRRYALHAMVLTLMLTLAAKSIAAVTLGRSTHWLPWLTPGVAAGLAAGSALVAGADVARAAWRAPRLPSLCLVAGMVVVNITPDNPYQTLPAFMLSVQPTHLTNFGNIVRILRSAGRWPPLMLLLGLARARPSALNRRLFTVKARP